MRYLFRYIQKNPDDTIIGIVEEAKVEGNVYRQKKGKRWTSRAIAAIQEVNSSTDKEEWPIAKTPKGAFSEMTEGNPTTGDILADYHQ